MEPTIPDSENRSKPDRFDEELRALRAQRELYRRLCGLAMVEDPQVFVAQTVRLLVDASLAEQGYLELRRDGRVVVSWAHDMADVAGVRQALSSGVLAKALETGRVVASARGVEDPEFSEYQSVRSRQIQAVLCAPIGDPVVGALYLQGHKPGGPFADETRLLVADLVALLGPMASRFLIDVEGDPTARWRARLGDASALIGSSQALATLLRDIAMVAQVQVPVLAVGPAGSGKTLAMRLVHDSGARRNKAFVERNCALLQPELAAAELFGAVRGAFTGATNRRGAVEEADGGTLFLDEITELDPKVQAMLLRFLESGAYNRVGESASRHADVRVLAATNADVKARLASGQLRQDLFSRLNGFPVRVPGLSERVDDVVPIARDVLTRFCAAQGWPVASLSAGAELALTMADWSAGSIRALIHTVQAGVIRAHLDGGPVSPSHLFPGQSDPVRAVTWHDATRVFQRRLLQSTLDDCDGNVPEAAERLDIDRSYIYRMLRAEEE